MQLPGQDWAAKWSLYSPHKIAIKDYPADRTFTYQQLNQLGNWLAHYLTDECKLGKGNRIAVLSEYGWEYIVLFVAAQKTGCILVPMNYRLKAPELDYLLNNAEPGLLIVEKKFEAEIQRAECYTNMERVLALEDLRNHLTAALHEANTKPFQITPVDEDDPIFILYTSGTTGFPKGAMYSHKMLFWNSINTAMTLLVNTESRTINCMPPFHTGGWNVLTTPFLHHGGYSCLLKSFDPKLLLELLVREQPTVFMAVPTMLKMLADEPGFDRANLSNLNYIIVGGEPMPIPLIEKWQAKDVPIRQGYGMTEVGPNLTSLHHDDAIKKKGSIGRPNFYVDVKIVDNAGKEVPAGKAGELILKGPMVTPGYWKNESATQKVIQDGWFHTGDMARRDEADYLFIVDRIKNMFISGGENVYPAEVERTIIQHELVNEVAVVSVPHAKWGEVGKAFVVCKEKMEASAIVEHCRERLANFKVPKYVVFVDHIPKNNTGKVDRKALKDKALGGL